MCPSAVPRGHSPAVRRAIAQRCCESSGGDALVMVVQAADLGNFGHATLSRRLDLTWFGAVQLEGLMGPPAVVVVEVIGQQPFQMPLVDHDHVVEAFAADRPDQSLDVRALPGASGSGEHLLEAHVADALPERGAVDSVSIPQQVPGRVHPVPNPPCGKWT